MDATDNLPDIDNLMNTITDFMEYINKPEMLKLEKSNKNEFEQHVDKKFSEFSYRYYGIFKMLLNRHNRKDNLRKIIEMIERLQNVKEGKSTIDDEFYDFKEELNNEYIYSKYGSKEKFEKAMLRK